MQQVTWDARVKPHTQRPNITERRGNVNIFYPGQAWSEREYVPTVPVDPSSADRNWSESIISTFHRSQTSNFIGHQPLSTINHLFRRCGIMDKNKKRCGENGGRCVQGRYYQNSSHSAHHRARAIRGWACLTAPGVLAPNISRNSGHSGDTPRQSTRQEMSIPAPRVVQNRNRSQNVTNVETNLDTHTEAANAFPRKQPGIVGNRSMHSAPWRISVADANPSPDPTPESERNFGPRIQMSI